MRKLVVWALLVIVWPLSAQEQKPITLTLHRAPAAVSALKYRLLPEIRDMQSGNAVVHYLRAMSPDAIGHLARGDAMEKLQKILDSPINQLKNTDLSGMISPFACKSLEDGARCTHADWEMVARVRRDGFALLIPEVQSMRQVALQLVARARVAVAEGRFDDAQRDICTSLAMSRHVADSVTLIQGLVGMAIANLSLQQVEDWIGQPNAPSLYWPLTDLPTPFIDLRSAFHGERFFIESVVPGFRDAKPGQFHVDRDKFMTTLGGLTNDGSISGNWASMVYTLAVYPAAKEYLKSRGWTDAQINATTAFSAVVLHQAWEYDRIYDEYLKVLNLPVPDALQGFDRIDKQIRPGLDRPSGLVLAGMLLPAVSKVYTARVRTDRRIAALRTIEAIRLHLTVTGKLPERLEEIKVVPVPVDVVTGKPFQYRGEGDKASLLAPPLGDQINPQRVYYSLAVGK